MPHVFDHTPTTQEVFDEACRYFATTDGPSTVKRSYGENCRYRTEETGRACVAGHFIPDESYVPAMDGLVQLPEYKGGGSGVENLVLYLNDKLPSWFRAQLTLLKRLQSVHDEHSNWADEYSWDHAAVATHLSVVASSLALNPSAIEQVKARHVPAGWQSVEA